MSGLRPEGRLRSFNPAFTMPSQDVSSIDSIFCFTGTFVFQKMYFTHEDASTCCGTCCSETVFVQRSANICNNNCKSKC